MLLHQQPEYLLMFLQSLLQSPLLELETGWNANGLLDGLLDSSIKHNKHT
jgi:hypothetical protein